ncbi:MAG: transglycosylase domain-containing protein [Clostridium sp.]|uniref:transglycosylase domain-containing protein n=1 Tax=Clostridium sp. TaxID=1506 RepID=UPI00290C0A0D|nr:transglycosylase domain-containing protein [Clostridium sp.]MDU7339125.1 transglycosylase domain-containing protein [Clostridium sp.]
MRKTDLNKYVGAPDTSRAGSASIAVRIAARGVGSIVAVLAVAGVIVLFFLISFVMSFRNESIKMDLNNLKLNYTSFIYVNNESDQPVEYQRLYSSENRIWVDYDKIPQNMKNAMVAIEDKRFMEHNGVDWRRTAGAVTTLFTKGGSYGGSTITQQLVKNITGDNEVSLTRKVKEIFRAVNLDSRYSKEQILEAYLNVVNYGSGCQGVQAAANLYFDKEISQATLAECASIAAITQNPYKYNPLNFPQNNKTRQQIVLKEMLDQQMISQDEYNTAMEETNHMVFVGNKNENVVNDSPVWNWYVDAMFEDIVEDLQATQGISKEKAVYMMYHGGLKIYSAMDPKAQRVAEEVVSGNGMPSDKKIQLGYYMMDYNGRVLATIGRRGEKTGNRLLSYATDSQRQPGSSIKPIASYGPAIDMGVINYSTILPDEPVDNYFGPGKPGPNNWYRKFYGSITVQRALEISSNAAAARLVKKITPSVSYRFLTEQLGFTHLNPKTDSVQISAMAIGGMNGGVTVKEMTAAYQMFGNGGQYFKPFTYYYVEDHDGNVILDNRQNAGTQVIKSSTATIMNRVLRTVVYGSEGTGGGAAVSGWEVFGKTGTTDEDKDSWFVGGTAQCVAGIWTGYETPKSLSHNQKENYTRYATKIWKSIMTQYLDGKKKVSFPTDSNVVSATFRTDNGKLSGANVGVATKTGWYERGNMPEVDTSPPLNSEVNSEVISEPENSKPENSQGESQEEPSPGTSSKSEWEPSKPSKPENPHSSAPSSHSPVDGNRPGQDNNGLWVPPDT